MRLRPGFSLTELLVVIFIIAILAAISFFGIKRIREMADKSGSIRNLTQLQVANISYATDHNGEFVSLKEQQGSGTITGRWFQNQEFLSNLTGMSPEELERKGSIPIPLEMLDPKVVRARLPLYDRIYTSYGMSDAGLMGTTENSPRSHNMNKIPSPARAMAFATATDYRVTYEGRFKWNFENPNDAKTAGGEMAYRHGRKVLAVYFDGHAAELSKADIEEIDRSSGGKDSSFWNPKK